MRKRLVGAARLARLERLKRAESAAPAAAIRSSASRSEIAPVLNGTTVVRNAAAETPKNACARHNVIDSILAGENGTTLLTKC